MASKFFNNHLEQVGSVMYNSGSVPTGTIKLALITTSYTFDETDAFWSDITGEASGTGYTAGGSAVSNITVTQNDGADGADIDFDNLTFSNITVSNVDSYILYYDTGTASTSQLICRVEFSGGVQSIVDGDFVVTPPASGALRFASA